MNYDPSIEIAKSYLSKEDSIKKVFDLESLFQSQIYSKITEIEPSKLVFAHNVYYKMLITILKENANQNKFNSMIISNLYIKSAHHLRESVSLNKFFDYGNLKEVGILYKKALEFRVQQSVETLNTSDSNLIFQIKWLNDTKNIIAEIINNPESFEPNFDFGTPESLLPIERFLTNVFHPSDYQWSWLNSYRMRIRLSLPNPNK